MKITEWFEIVTKQLNDFEKKKFVIKGADNLLMKLKDSGKEEQYYKLNDKSV